MIPKKIHFVFGLDEAFSGKPFSFFHYLAIKSAKSLNPDYDIWMHVQHQPENNEWWKKSMDYISGIRILFDVPTAFGGKEIIYPEHKCDYLRLCILRDIGGIYLDIDTLTLTSFDCFLNHQFVIGKEKNEFVDGLCNAVLMAEPNSKFGDLWLQEFSGFDPNIWGCMAVQAPHELSLKHPELVKVEPPSSFFKYDWYHLIDLFNGYVYDLAGMHVIHLWENKTYHALLRHITPEDVESRDCLYNVMAR